MSKNVIPECWADTVVIEVIGYNKPNHIMGIGQVINVINKNYTNKIGIGFIDRDKSRKGYEENTKYRLINSAINNSIQLKQKEDTNHYLILHPNVENWLYNMALELNVNHDRYRVADLLTNNKKYKSQSIYKDPYFRNFINTLYQKDNSPLKIIKNWIDEILIIPHP